MDTPELGQTVVDDTALPHLSSGGIIGSSWQNAGAAGTEISKPPFPGPFFFFFKLPLLSSNESKAPTDSSVFLLCTFIFFEGFHKTLLTHIKTHTHFFLSAALKTQRSERHTHTRTHTPNLGDSGCGRNVCVCVCVIKLEREGFSLFTPNLNVFACVLIRVCVRVYVCTCVCVRTRRCLTSTVQISTCNRSDASSHHDSAYSSRLLLFPPLCSCTVLFVHCPFFSLRSVLGFFLCG